MASPVIGTTLQEPSTLETKLLWVSIAPLGSPVVPEV